MKKKYYSSPDLEIVSLSMIDVLAASKYTEAPEDPTRAGDEGDDDIFD